MKRFRINENQQIIIIARYKGEIIEKTRFFGYSNLKDIKSKFLNSLSYEWKNKGKRIELTFFNQSTNEYKYINTFS